MPLFFNKFNPKKTPPRKAPLSAVHSGLSTKRAQEELGLHIGEIKLRLGGIESVFEDGEWISESSSGQAVSSKSVSKLKQRTLTLEEENNMLRIKIEVLLDMLTEVTDESIRQRKELDELRNFVRGSRNKEKGRRDA
ncbi:protein chibby homolog 1 [Ischnura elegans]|uniref:protein chibby homolog 1 n=1 Tax=Ischnura elegans TaxID=197161 RepID=UPI001ED8A723|nr:protein chibby homolog 1 [Ischnura elegans]